VKKTAYTMRDVASRAGVSLATVSHVLNKTRYTAPETVERVLGAAKELNYYKNVHARRLAMGRSDLFGLLISEIANPYFSDIITGFQTSAWEHGFDVLLCNTEYDPGRTQTVIQKLLESNVRDVAVLTSSIEGVATAELTAAGIGLVFNNSGTVQTLVSSLRIDYLKGISQAIDYIVGLGHKKVAVIAGPQSNRTAIILRDALLSGLKARRLRPFPVLETDFRVDSGASAVREILAQPDTPSVVFCGNDLIAMGAMSALEEAGVEVPEDVSVIGFDDIFFASLARPPLTTIHIPRAQLGVLAFEALNTMLNRKLRRGAEYSVETKLVVRRSTAAPTKKRILRPGFNRVAR